MGEYGELPREVLETAVGLRDPLREVYLALFRKGEAVMARDVAGELDLARAYVHMRLNQLADMGVVVRSKDGRKVKFEVKPAR